MSRLSPKNALPIADVLREMFRSSGASASHNSRRIFSAWDEASGAAAYTIRRFYRDGILYITMKSSVLATQLSMQKSALTEKINAILSDDPLFIREDSHTGFVKELRIK